MGAAFASSSFSPTFEQVSAEFGVSEEVYLDFVAVCAGICIRSTGELYG